MLLATSVLLVAMAAGQSEATAPGNINAEQIAAAVEQLNSAEFEVRQRASAVLWQAGQAAEPALRQALTSNSGEVRLRAHAILNDFRYGVFADTPPEVAALVRRFRDAEELRERLWADVAKIAPLETLLAIAAAEPHESLRVRVLERIEASGDLSRALELAEQWQRESGSQRGPNGYDQFISRQLPYLLAQQRFDKAAEILKRQSATESGLRDWAVFQLLRGGLDQEIAALRTEFDSLAPNQAQNVGTRLCTLLQVQGDLLAARQVAVRLAEAKVAPRLLPAILFELREWPELAKLQQQRADLSPHSVEELGFAAAYHRLTGNQAQLDAAINAVRGIADASSGANGQTRAYCREVFFLNGLTEEAITMWETEDEVEAFRLRCLQQRYVEAFAAAGIGNTRDSRAAWLRKVLEALPGNSPLSLRQFKITLQAAQILQAAGEESEANEFYSRLAAVLTEDRDGIRLRELAESELRAGMVEAAFEHALLALDKDRSLAAIELLFPRHKAAAKHWWEIYQQLQPTETNSARAAQLRKLFYTGTPGEERAVMVKDVADSVLQLDPPHESRRVWLNTIGETALLHENVPLARRCFEAVADTSAPAAVHLGDLLAKEEQWTEAGQWYGRAWELDSKKPYVLYLRGDMLVRSGDEAAGRRMMELARLIPLASGDRHEGLATPLWQRNYRKEAEAEWDLMRRASNWTQASMFVGVGALGDALSERDPLAATSLWEQRMLNCLQENWFFTDQSSYIRIPHLLHSTRAKALLAAGQVEAALRDVALCREIWPGSSADAEEFVPKLDAAGQTATASQMFDEAFAMLEENCRVYPQSALHHNNLAWMAARCKRRLDDALTHVQRALELVPDSVQYLDTLGEVHFQRGDIAEAIACARRCVELDPNTEFYQEQLTRYLESQQQPR